MYCLFVNPSLPKLGFYLCNYSFNLLTSSPFWSMDIFFSWCSFYTWVTDRNTKQSLISLILFCHRLFIDTPNTVSSSYNAIDSESRLRSLLDPFLQFGRRLNLSHILHHSRKSIEEAREVLIEYRRMISNEEIDPRESWTNEVTIVPVLLQREIVENRMKWERS